MPVRWDELDDAYGPAGLVPELLERLEPDPEAEVWEELYSRICHQGSVYSASYPSLSYLLAAAQLWSPVERSAPLSLAGAIVSAPDADTERLAEYGSMIAALRDLAAVTLESTDLSREDTVFVAQAVLAFRGDRLWGQWLDGLVSGEFPGVCPRCEADLYLVVGEYGFFTTAQEWVNRASTPRAAIDVAAAGELGATGRWLLEVASRQQDEELAVWFRHLFGTTSCPACSFRFRVADAVRAVA